MSRGGDTESLMRHSLVVTTLTVALMAAYFQRDVVYLIALLVLAITWEAYLVYRHGSCILDNAPNGIQALWGVIGISVLIVAHLYTILCVRPDHLSTGRAPTASSMGVHPYAIGWAVCAGLGLVGLPKTLARPRVLAPLFAVSCVLLALGTVLMAQGVGDLASRGLCSRCRRPS
jgi:hypothetical protein